MINVLFRKDRQNEDEFNICQSILTTTQNRSACLPNSRVIGRYSVLPFYGELEDDLFSINAKLVNSYANHRWVANFDYYEQLKDFTFETWDQNEFPYSDYQGPFIVKGRTNSKKHKWSTHMFAKDRRDAVEVAIKILDDSHYDDQGIIYRKYIPLKKLSEGLTGIPFSNEWRFFFLYGKLVDYGYYWSISDRRDLASIDKEGLEFAQMIADVAKNYCPFVVVDIAEKADGGWILVELNDGQMSGLSDIDPFSFYSNLKKLSGEMAAKLE